MSPRKARGKTQIQQRTNHLKGSSLPTAVPVPQFPESTDSVDLEALPRLALAWEPLLDAHLHETVREYSQSGIDQVLSHLLHPDITIVPCSQLSIGSWRRMAATPRSTGLDVHTSDLIVYYTETEQRLSFFLQDAETAYRLRMDISFSVITDMHVLDLAPSSATDLRYARAVLSLSAPPAFLVERQVDSGFALGTTKTWEACQDWTADGVASSVLTHELVGPPAPLQFLRDQVIGPVIPMHSRPPSFDYALLPITTEQSQMFRAEVPPPPFCWNASNVPVKTENPEVLIGADSFPCSAMESAPSCTCDSFAENMGCSYDACIRGTNTQFYEVDWIPGGTNVSVFPDPCSYKPYIPYQLTDLNGTGIIPFESVYHEAEPATSAQSYELVFPALM